jgi:predicted Zn-dependent protease
MVSAALPRRRCLTAGLGLALLCGCAGAEGPPGPSLLATAEDAPDAAALRAAREEVEEDHPPLRRRVSDREFRATLLRVEERLLPAARAVCVGMGPGAVCSWDIRLSRDREVNAGAGERGRITINRGIVEYTENDEQFALVLGHEIAHQAAAHIARSRIAQEVGAAVGAVVMGGLALAVAGVGEASPRASGRAVRDITRGGGAIGGRFGRLAYSKEQEREADRLSLLMLHRAGYDPVRARGLLLTMARLSRQRDTGLLDTHPAGPERLAAFDRSLAALQGGRGAASPLPPPPRDDPEAAAAGDQPA